MAGPTNETAVVESILKAIYQRYPNAWHLKVHGSGMQRSGVPDLILCINGRFFGFEVKHRKPRESLEHAYNRTSTLQKIKIRQIKKAGGVATTVLGPEETLEIIERSLRL